MGSSSRSRGPILAARIPRKDRRLRDEDQLGVVSQTNNRKPKIENPKSKIENRLCPSPCSPPHNQPSSQTTTEAQMRIRHVVLLFLLTLFATGSAAAQTLIVYNVDASGFPTIKANFIVLDARGNRIP